MTINVFASGANRRAKPYVFASGANRVLREVWVFSGGANRRVFVAFNIAVSPTNYSISLNTTNGPASWQTSFTVSTEGVGPFTYSWGFVSGSVGTLSGTTTSTCIASGSGFGNSEHTGTLRCSVTDMSLGESLFVDIPMSVTYFNNQ